MYEINGSGPRLQADLSIGTGESIVVAIKQVNRLHILRLFWKPNDEGNQRTEWKEMASSEAVDEDPFVLVRNGEDLMVVPAVGNVLALHDGTLRPIFGSRETIPSAPKTGAETKIVLVVDKGGPTNRCLRFAVSNGSLRLLDTVPKTGPEDELRAVQIGSALKSLMALRKG